MRDRRNQDEHCELELSGIGAASRPDNSTPLGDASKTLPGGSLFDGNNAL